MNIAIPASLPNPTDTDLVARCSTGGRDAFAPIVERYQALVCSVAYSGTGSFQLSEDLAQETFIIAWKQLAQLREPEKLRGWLCGIARKLVSNSRRRLGREPAHAAEELAALVEIASIEPLPSEQAVSREQEAILWGALERIPETYREPLVLFYREHRSIERVAADLELSEDAVKQRLSRGRKLLQEQVLDFVEGALARTSPGTAFTVGVLAAIPLLAAPSTASAAAVTVSKGGATASTASLGLWSQILAATGLGLFAIWLGYRVSMTAMRTPRERGYLLRYMRQTMLLALGNTATVFGCVYVAANLGGEFAKSLALAGGVFELVYSAIVLTLVLRFNRGFRALRLDEIQRAPELFHATKDSNLVGVGWARDYRSKRTLLGLPLIDVRLGLSHEGRPRVARGWIAVGDRAYGVLLAFGGIAIGGISAGGIAIGAVSIGGVGLGALVWAGVAVGWFAIGGVALGVVASGGVAFGWVAAQGGVAIARDYALGGMPSAHAANDAAASAFFAARPWIDVRSGSGRAALLVCYLPLLVVLAASRWWRPRTSLLIFAMIAMLTSTHAADLSPGTWPTDDRERLEKLESQTWSPLEAKLVEGTGGLVSATVSPIAVHAGLQALKIGGSAADAAATIALTQITTQLGSVVSYAGIFTMVYYDAATKKVFSLDAGYNTYLNETDPLTIPVGDLGPLNFVSKPTEGGAKGRETLVPGFMAGLEAMHSRFGRLPFRDLFAPAIWYDEHGVVISPSLSGFFYIRAKFLSRTPEGRAFLHQAGNEMPMPGDRFVQTELAATLKKIAEQGSRYMYTGKWGQDFVSIVQREGGKVTAEDMERYEPTWSEPRKETVFGHDIYTNGAPHYGAFQLISGLNLAAALHLDVRGSYTSDAGTFRDLARINASVVTAPAVSANAAALFRSKGIDASPEAQLDKSYARALAPLLDEIFATPTADRPKHSNAVVVIDRNGNIAAITHTINAVIWGDTGIVVGGIPIPDSAAFQQRALAAINPGERLPHQIIDTIALEGDTPVLATASIGSSLAPESIRVLLGVLGQRQDLATVMARPPLLATFAVGGAERIPTRQAVTVPKGAYSTEFIATLAAGGLNVTETPTATVSSLRGTLAAIAIDPKTGKRTAANQPDVMVFNSAE